MIKNIQIFGTKKCRRTQKAERFFKERGIKYHFVDLTEKGIAKGELDNISRSVSMDELLDTESKSYKEKGFAHRIFDAAEEILEDPLLLNTPVVRNGDQATAGDNEKVWKEWIKGGA